MKEKKMKKTINENEIKLLWIQKKFYFVCKFAKSENQSERKQSDKMEKKFTKKKKIGKT